MASRHLRGWKEAMFQWRPFLQPWPLILMCFINFIVFIFRNIMEARSNLTRLTRMTRLTHLRYLTHLSNFFEVIGTGFEKGPSATQRRKGAKLEPNFTEGTGGNQRVYDQEQVRWENLRGNAPQQEAT